MESPEAWEVELDRLELDVIRAERMLRTLGDGALDEWQEPAVGPLPAALLPRATELLARQEQVRAELARALGATSRQRAFATRVTDATTTPAVPTYLDVTA